MSSIPDEAIAAVDQKLADSGTPGAVLAVKCDDAPVAVAAVGSEGRDGMTPLSPDGWFPLYSVTKMLLAAAALRLVDADRLALDADVRELLPDMPLPGPVTLRQVLNHTSGLPDYGGLARYTADLRADPASPWTDAMFIDRTLEGGFAYPPGEGWAYSNIGYLLVRHIVARLGGDGSLATALRRLVFDPAGCKDMAVVTSLADMARFVPGYSLQLDSGQVPRDVRGRYHPGWVAHGLVAATAADTARATAALFDGALLRPSTLAEMKDGVPVPGNHPPFGRAGYGLGLMVDLDPRIAMIAGHAGGGPGYSTAAFRFETAGGRRVTSIALANRDAGDIGTQIAFLLGRAALDLAI